MSIFYSENAEKAILGNIILNNDVFFKLKKIAVEDFFIKKNRLIFEGLKKLILSDVKPVDPIVLLETIENEELDIEYINNIISLAYKKNNVKYYSKILKKKSLKRKFLSFIQIIKDDIKKNISLGKIKNKIYQNLDSFSKEKESSVSLKRKFFYYSKNYNKKKKKILTGYKILDSLTSGLHKGELVVIAGRPSMGKTAFAINICENISINSVNKKNLNSVIFTMEMSSDQILIRMLSSLLKENSCILNEKKIKKNKILKIKKKILGSKIILDDSSSLTPEKLKLKIKNILNKKKKIDIVIIDYLQLMNISNFKENRTNEVSKISRSLKNIAKQFNIVIIAISQLNRNSEQRYDRTPILSDLRESGSIEQDADLILLMYNNNINEKFIKFIIAKNRNGPTGTFKLKFIKNLTKFKNI